MMSKRMGRWGIGILIALLALAWTCLAETAEQDAVVKPHNYILVIDNSRSTTGKHSLGGATDPRGLRFDAAQLVYQNVVSSGEMGSRGQLGVIVFCGPKNCVSYGPLDIADPALDDKIGKYLNAAANAARRDVYTDIRTALQKASDMMAGFEGDTSVILLTDGVNDLSNRSDPFSRPENIKANEQSAQIVAQMHAQGANFQVIALSDQENVANTDPFMVFINQLAEAGGGEMGKNGEYNNVLMATQADLNSKLVQMLIKAESASESIQTIVESAPLDAPFTVPYNGITEATVNITFMPEDKPMLEQVAVVDPSGQTHVLWNAGEILDEAGITATENRSYIMLDMAEPMAGEWRLQVDSREASVDSSDVLINAVVRFNHNLRVRVEMADTVPVDESTRIDAWFQVYDGEVYEDLTDSDIYALSKATLTVITPSGNKKKVAMKQEGDRYTVHFKPKIVGDWKAEVKVQNPYVQQTLDDITFHVTAPESSPEPTPEATPEASVEASVAPTATPRPTPRPTPTPTPTPTPEPEVVPITSLALSIEPSVTTEAGEIFLSGEKTIFSWTLEEETDSLEAVLMQGNKVIGKLNSGMSFDSSFFKQGELYGFRVTAMPKNGELMGAKPVIQTLIFRAAPLPLAEGDITLDVQPRVEDSDDAMYVDRNAEQITLSWSVASPTDAVTARLLEDGAPIASGLQSGDTVERGLLKDGAQYTLLVDALPKNSGLVGIQPTQKALEFALYPLPTAVQILSLDVSGSAAKNGVSKVKGNSAQLAWTAGGNIDHYEVTVTDMSGNLVSRETLPASATGYTLNKGKGDVKVELAAVPRYATADDATVARASVTVHSLSLIERFWYILVAAVLLLAGGGVALFMVLKERNAKRVTGTLRVRCDALNLNQLLTFFDDRKGVKENGPITGHAELAKLKGKPAYALLSNVKLNNAVTDREGRAPGEDREGEPRHRGNARVMRLTVTDPRTKQDAVYYVGRYDIEPTAVTLSDGTQEQDFTFTGA